MENNEISMVMDVKLDIPDKRPDSLKLKSWTRCDVKIEAIKCLPCFLRITFTCCDSDEFALDLQQKLLSVSINVPGLSISLAASRTKQYSYGLFWTHNRRDCYIYFALETESSCRRHMKWIKKSIKNLELHRQIFLEQRRNSRGPSHILHTKGVAVDKWKAITYNANTNNEKSGVASAIPHGPLPTTPLPDFGLANISAWSTCNSRVSDIYEEILDDVHCGNDSLRHSRRCSHISIASGIYEEMIPMSAIVEESAPPLPPPRKRVNTFETECQGLLGEIARSNTNPESELVKKKKYKNVFDIFGGTRQKRAESVSETQTCTVEEFVLSTDAKPTGKEQPLPSASARPTNEEASAKKEEEVRIEKMAQLKRNSFSSPDLSKINFLEMLDDDKMADGGLMNSFSSIDGLGLSADCLDESSILPEAKKEAQNLKAAGSLESVNISQRIPNNFNFSACNTSKINLIGANGAAPLTTIKKKNKILVDDMTGYCVMAPIIKKPAPGTEENDVVPSCNTESTSSGYSTASVCSSTSSSANVQNVEDLKSVHPITTKLIKSSPIESKNLSTIDKAPPTDESTIYENMLGSFNASDATPVEIRTQIMETPPLAANFSNHLYDNLLTMKAAQELEHPLPIILSTSTPTESPLGDPSAVHPDEEDYYQTPRKSIISVDDKVPSYYPNSCDTVKTRRRCDSSTKSDVSITPTSTGYQHLMSVKLRRERKENLYISSPQKLIEQRQQSTQPMGPISPTIIANKLSRSLPKLRKTAAHKISESVYAVRHSASSKKSPSVVIPSSNNNNNNNNNKSDGVSGDLKEQLQTELVQLAILKNIDFKFDDTKSVSTGSDGPVKEQLENFAEEQPRKCEVKSNLENCIQVTETATRLLHKYAVLTKYGATPSSTKLAHKPDGANDDDGDGDDVPTKLVCTTPLRSPNEIHQPAVTVAGSGSGIRKFASLPRFKKIDFSPLKLRINNVLQRNQQQQQF